MTTEIIKTNRKRTKIKVRDFKGNIINYSFPDIKSILPEGGLIISSGKTCDGGKLPHVSSFFNTLIKVHSMRARIKKAKRFKNKSARF